MTTPAPETVVPPADIRQLLAGKRHEPRTAQQWRIAETGAAACGQDFPGGNVKYGDALIGTNKFWRAAYELRYHELLAANAHWMYPSLAPAQEPAA